MTPENWWKSASDKPLEFKPGTKWNYSNSGYILLGYLIEKISGQSYSRLCAAEYLHAAGNEGFRIRFRTPRLSRTGPQAIRRARAAPLNAGFVHMSIPFSAGALYSTTEDLLRWEQGLFGGKLLKPDSLTKMTTPFKQDYAFGLGVSIQNGHKMIAHDGGIQRLQYFFGLLS